MSDDMDIDITGIDKAALLMELHNSTLAMGMGRLQDRGRITHEQAAGILAARLGGDFSDDFITTEVGHDAAVAAGFVGPKAGVFHFDYLNGRPIKMDIGGSRLASLDVRLYERDCPGGWGTVERIVARLRAQGDGGRRA